MNLTRAQALLLTGYGGAALVFVGSLMPWVTGPFGIAVSGTSGDGVITLLLALISLGRFALAVRPNRAAAWPVIFTIVTVLCCAITVYEFVHISSTEFAGVGSGLVVVAIGSIALVGAVVLLRKAPTSRPES